MLDIIFEDDEIIVVNKASGIITEKNPWEDAVESQVFNHLKSHSKRAQPFLGVIHRLDRVTSGVLVFAKKKSILKVWNKCFEERMVHKQYLAISRNKLPLDTGTLDHWHFKDLKNKKALISLEEKDGFKKCSLRYALLEKNEDAFLYELSPLTGRFHQIRAQMAYASCPIIGDEKYGGGMTLKNKIALHAYRLKLDKLDKTFEAEVESNVYWKDFKHLTK